MENQIPKCVIDFLIESSSGFNKDNKNLFTSVGHEESCSICKISAFYLRRKPSNKYCLMCYVRKYCFIEGEFIYLKKSKRLIFPTMFRESIVPIEEEEEEISSEIE